MEIARLNMMRNCKTEKINKGEICSRNMETTIGSNMGRLRVKFLLLIKRNLTRSFIDSPVIYRFCTTYVVCTIYFPKTRNSEKKRDNLVQNTKRSWSLLDTQKCVSIHGNRKNIMFYGRPMYFIILCSNGEGKFHKR